MLKPDIAGITTTMIAAFAEMRKAGEKRAFAQSFPFKAEDVACIHTFKSGEGAGTWFRLDDGRVFTRHGKPAAPDAGLYDTATAAPPDETARQGSGAPENEDNQKEDIQKEAGALQEEAVAGMKKSLEQAWFNDGYFGACKKTLQATKAVLDALKSGETPTALLWLAEARAAMQKARQAATEQRDETD